ncbi:MAG: sugar-binding transcriptional regulator, partial [Phyllobacterium sp.]
TTLGVADAAAAEMTRWLKSEAPVILGIGTGRTLKAAIELLSPIECPQHKVVSLTGNISPDGSAAFYNVIFNMADKIKARSFPMPLPVIASSLQERELLHDQAMIRSVLELSAQANVAFIGIGDLEDDAPLYVDGFISREELLALRRAGAVCEIVGRAFDRNGVAIEGLTNDRVASARIPSRDTALVIAIAKGPRKMPGIAAAIRGNLINGLITDESTAESLLET